MQFARSTSSPNKIANSWHNFQRKFSATQLSLSWKTFRKKDTISYYGYYQSGRRQTRIVHRPGSAVCCAERMKTILYDIRVITFQLHFPIVSWVGQHRYMTRRIKLPQARPRWAGTNKRQKNSWVEKSKQT